MTVFITGATGFLGNHLVKMLVSQGIGVHAIVRTPAKAKDLEHPLVKLFKGDLQDTAALNEAMKGCDGVIHMAAYADTWNKDPFHFYKVNVLGTVNVMEAALANGVKRVVVTSTAGTLGPSYGEPVTESTVRLEDFHTEYESSKFVSEERALRYTAKGIDVIIVHPSRVYGPGELGVVNSWAKLSDMWLRKGRAFALGDGNGIGNFVHVEDVVMGHILALQKGRSGERYLLGAENASAREFFKLLTEASGKKGRLITVPLWVVFPISRFFAWRARWFKVHPLITPPWVRRYDMNWTSSSDKARTELGYNPRPLKQGLDELCTWLKNRES